MQTYENTNLIFMVGLEIYQVSNLSELNKIIFGSNFNVLSESEKIEKRIEKAKTISLAYNLPIISCKSIKEYSPRLLYTIVVDNEKLYYATLCKNRIFEILERKDARIFLKDIEADKSPRILRELEIQEELLEELEPKEESEQLEEEPKGNEYNKYYNPSMEDKRTYYKISEKAELIIKKYIKDQTEKDNTI